MANEGGKKPELARQRAFQRTIPNALKTIAVGVAGATFDLSSMMADDGDNTATDLRGHWVYLCARGGDITILRKGTAVTTAGAGFVCKDGIREEFWVDPDEDAVVGAKAGASVSLDVTYDTKL